MSISFCHYGNENMASYRYRCQMPAQELGVEINNPKADVLIFSKPSEEDIPYLVQAREEGRKVIADFCDMHFHLPHYALMLKESDVLTCPTQWFAESLREMNGVEALVVHDPYEYPEVIPHCAGNHLLWFGHGLNIDSLIRVAPLIVGYPMAIVSNVEGMIPWSKSNLLEQFLKADIVVMPETAPYKSANRTVESIRQGCFVVAEPHPAINAIPGIWIGNIKEGIEWASHNQSEANTRTRLAQDYVREKYSLPTQGFAWRKAIQRALSSSTSAAETSTGPVGSMSMVTATDGMAALAPI